MGDRLAVIRNIDGSGTVDSVVSHNHTGLLRDRGECPACDQCYEFFAA